MAYKRGADPTQDVSFNLFPEKQKTGKSAPVVEVNNVAFPTGVDVQRLKDEAGKDVIILSSLDEPKRTKKEIILNRLRHWGSAIGWLIGMIVVTVVANAILQAVGDTDILSLIGSLFK